MLKTSFEYPSFTSIVIFTLRLLSACLLPDGRFRHLSLSVS